MATVKQISDIAKQPWGGYIKKSDFSQFVLEDGKTLNPTENIDPSVVGTVVDYLTRYVMGDSLENAFAVSIKGAILANQKTYALDLLSNIHGLDNNSIVNACKLVGFDVCYRASISYFKGVELIEADASTVENIFIMVNRCVLFWQQYGPIVKSGFTFEGGYSPIVTSGDGDYLTRDTIWELKVLKGEIRSKHSLQLLIYYIMGKRSIHPEFKSVQKIGIYNPRYNKIYLLETEKIPQETIMKVSNEVLKYHIEKNKGKASERKIAEIVGKNSQSENNVFYIGARCAHVSFGKGTIVYIKGQEIMVHFDSGQEKRLYKDFLIKNKLMTVLDIKNN